MVQYSKYIVDLHIATEASAFTEANIPDMSTHDVASNHWIANFFLNSVFRGKYDGTTQACIYNYLRRAQFAFQEYGRARDASVSFINTGSKSPTRYAEALFHWEIFLGQAWHAYKLLQHPFGVPKIYDKGDGSVQEKLNTLYNQMKHVESRIDCGQMPNNGTVPVWLVNAGLKSVDASMTFFETTEVLKELSKFATILQDPVSSGSKLDELSEKK